MSFPIFPSQLSPALRPPLSKIAGTAAPEPSLGERIAALRALLQSGSLNRHMRIQLMGALQALEAQQSASGVDEFKP